MCAHCALDLFLDSVHCFSHCLDHCSQNFFEKKNEIKHFEKSNQIKSNEIKNFRNEIFKNKIFDYDYDLIY